MDARRIDLRLKWKDVITLAGISPQTLSKIRSQGTIGVDSLIIAKVEHALRWSRGSLQSLTDGSEPSPLQPLGSGTEQPYADMSDPDEAAAWRMNLPEDVRRNLVDAIRAGRAHHRQA